MSFIQKNDAVIINTKLTNAGRLLLASGSLTFKKIEFGDSEINYDFLRDFGTVIDGSDLSMMRPKDANPNIKYPIPVLSDNPTLTKSDIVPTPTPIQIVNTAQQRGFFTGSTSSGFTAFTSSTYIQGLQTISTSAVTGGTVITLPSVTNITADTMLLIDWRNPKLTTFTSTTGVIGESYPRQFLWYKVQSVVGNNVTVDKPLPNFNSQGGTIKSVVYVFPKNNAVDNYYSTGTTVAYWNYNTLAFDSTCNIGSNDNVPVWNLNLIYNTPPAGILASYPPQYYDSAIFTGFKEYIQGASFNSGKTQLAVIHYTNNSISNYYGEGFFNNTFKITLPTIMYHAKTDATMGIVISASTIKKTQPTNLTGFTTEYYDLVETTNPTVNIVGKVFNDLRIAVIEDEELINVMSLKSNRSHTLPKPNWSLKNATTQEISNNNFLLSTINDSIAVTYLFTNEDYNTNKSYGLKGGIHCGYIQPYKQDTTTKKNITFNFTASDLKFMKSQVTGSDGTGFNANKFYILAQKYTTGTEPIPANWQLIDFTSSLTNYNDWSATTIPVSALTDTVYTFDNNKYTAGTTYDITTILGSLPNTSDYTATNKLGFGEESILLGNINTQIKATVYRTQISKNLGFSQFNTSLNPTWESGDDVYISEVGIYDETNTLIAVGKINNPINKNNNKLVTIQLDMDF